MKKQPKSRNPIVLIAKSRNSSGPMRDKRQRRAKDARKSWKNETWS